MFKMTPISATLHQQAPNREPALPMYKVIGGIEWLSMWSRPLGAGNSYRNTVDTLNTMRQKNATQDSMDRSVNLNGAS